MNSKEYPRIKIKLPTDNLRDLGKFTNLKNDKWPNNIRKFWEKERKGGEMRLKKVVSQLEKKRGKKVVVAH